MDLPAYLRRIGYEGIPAVEPDTLRAIQLGHLRRVPFENLDIHLGRPIRLDLAAIYDKIVVRRRGGFCYELNGLLAEVLRRLGYEVTLLSATGFNDDGTFSAEFDHLVLLVLCPGQAARWLVDVGWGSGFEAPLNLDKVEPQPRGPVTWRIEQARGFYSLWELKDSGSWQPHYRFELIPRDYQEFAGMCAYHQTSPDSIFTQKRICTLFTPEGRVTLSESRLIITKDGVREEREIPEEQVASVLHEYFGIEPG